MIPFPSDIGGSDEPQNRIVQTMGHAPRTYQSPCDLKECVRIPTTWDRRSIAEDPMQAA